MHSRNTIVSALVATLMLFAFPASAWAQSATAEDLFRSGNESFQAGLYRKAVKAYKEAVAQKPEFKEAWYNLGVAYSKTAKFKNELGAYKKAVELDPKYSKALFNMAIAQEDSGALQDAIKTYERFLSQESGEKDTADAFVNVGILYAKTGQLDKAVNSYKDALTRDPDLADANFNLGLAYGKLADKAATEDEKTALRKEEVGAYKLTLKQRPTHYRAWYNLAISHNRAGQVEEEITAYQKALEIREKYPQALYNLATALSEKGDSKEAATAWARYLEIAADMPQEKAFLTAARTEMERLQAEAP